MKRTNDSRRWALILTIALVMGCWPVRAGSQSSPVRVAIDTAQDIGPMEIHRFSLGQGGLSDAPMWDDRIPEIRSLHPSLIRLFIQEYFDVYPKKGTYHWSTLDRSVDTILATGAEPIMCIAIKPSVLFPTIDQDIVEPSSYAEWEELVYQMVRHYQGRNIRYWEVSNEPDIGESGGCPSRFTAQNYPRFYEHTVKAILHADPQAKVGGPALANSRSPILRALLEHCSREKVPLHFVSWHIYNSNPLEIRQTIDRVKGLVAEFPSLNVETILNEWNMSLSDPVKDPRFQPCFIAEVAYQMFEGRLDYSCYYHIRDYHVNPDQFARFMSPQGNLFMARWWNDMPQFDGLFDFQNVVRPSFFTFRLLSRLTGNRLAVTSSAGAGQPHLFSAVEPSRDRINTLIWNFGLTDPPEVEVELEFKGLQGEWRIWETILDAATTSSDENHRLNRNQLGTVSAASPKRSLRLPPWDVRMITLEKRSR
ncbi:MAG: hypothetical protein AB1898_27120 [Acidobacteriota bacterium]